MPTLQQLSDLLGIPCPRDGSLELTGINALVDSRPGELSILASDRYIKDYAKTRASAVLAGRNVAFTPREDVPTLIVDDADLALVKILTWMAPPVPGPESGIDSTARVHASASIGENPSIAANVVIGANCRIGKNVRLYPGVVLCDDVTLGDDCTMFPNVVIRERSIIGNRVTIHAGSVIGTDGFGYRWDGRQHAKIPQIGIVVIEDDVEIGSCTCIDRAKFSETRIGRGTKIDNLVQIAHNVKLGMFNIVCGQAALAGTVQTGNGVVIGGGTGVADHIRIGDGVMIGGQSGVITNLPEKGVYSGFPAIPHRERLREMSHLRHLSELVDEVRTLRNELDELKKNLPQP